MNNRDIVGATARPTRRNHARFLVALGLALLTTGATVFAPSAPAQGATSPTEEWPTAVTGEAGAPGESVTIEFGSTGVTATNTLSTFNGACTDEVNQATNDPANQPNVTTFLEPDPGSAAFVMQCVGNVEGGGQILSTVAFNKPVIAPLLHVVNLDASKLTTSGDSVDGTAIAASPIVKNDALEVSGNTFNTTLQDPIQPGCMANDGTNPNGACGSLRLTTADGTAPISEFTLDNNTFDSTLIPGTDGWQWSLSFPTVTLAKAFSSSSIQVGQSTQLTFTIENPDNPAPVALNGISFVDHLPSGLRMTSPESTDNGSCGTPDVAGSTSIEVSEVSIEPGATCELTVQVTADSPGSYVNNDVEGGVANLISDGDASLEVTPAPPDVPPAPAPGGEVKAAEPVRARPTFTG